MSLILGSPELARRLEQARLHLARNTDQFNKIEDRWNRATDRLRQHPDAEIELVDQDESTLENLVEWLEQPTWALVLSGPPDSGKTYAAIAIAGEFALSGRKIKIRTAREIVASLKPGGDSTHADYSSADLLVIDGFSEVELSKWDIEQLKSLLLDRYERRQPTIMTSNLSATEIRAKLGDAVWSRFGDGAVMLWLVDSGRRTNRERFNCQGDFVSIWSRIYCHVQLSSLPPGKQQIARERIRAEIQHDPLDMRFTSDECDLFDAICWEADAA